MLLHVIKEIEKKKYLPKQIIEIMKGEGFINFSMHYHTKLWESLDAKNPNKGYGVLIAEKIGYGMNLGLIKFENIVKKIGLIIRNKPISLILRIS